MLNKNDQGISQKEMDALLNELKKQLSKRYPKPPILRAFHPKMHGLVKATFQVESSLPSELQTEVFHPGKKYDAWIRLSNGAREISSDKKKDLRGFAIKLIGVPGVKMLPDEQMATTQDILLANYPIFGPGTFHNTVHGIIATSGSIFQKLWYAITHIGTVIKALRSATHCDNLLNETYFSQVPYQYKEHFVKYILKPKQTVEIKTVSTETDFLKARLVDDLSHHAAHFDFFIQHKSEHDPLNDASVEWKGPLTKIGELHLPPQKFDSEAQIQYGQSLSFTPWHCVFEHRPAGDIGVARKEIYHVMSEYRLQHKATPEPTEIQQF